MSPSRVLIVGAGLAGSRCAETLRAEGYQGEVVVAGEEPHTPYERPALSKELLLGSRTDVRLRANSFWTERAIELRLSMRVASIDVGKRAALTSAGTLEWDALVLATGARARMLPALAGRPGVHVLRSLSDAEAIRDELRPGARLAVIGAGFVGSEVACSATRLGVEVTLVEAGPAPLARVLGPDIGRLLAARYRAHGVNVRLGACVEQLRPEANGALVLELTDGADVRCDTVLVAVGSEAADGPVQTDAHGRAEPPGVFACGDVASWWRPSLSQHVRSEHWTSAAAQGATVARTLLGGGEALDEPGYFWSDQFGLRLQHVGGEEPWEKTVLEGTPDAFVARYHASDGRLVGALLANQQQHAAALRREIAAARAA